MSSLVHLPAGQTLDYWWERLHGVPKRKRFLLTKIVEVAAYGYFRGKPSGIGSEVISDPVRELKPMIQRSGITETSAGMVVIPARCQTKSSCAQLDRLVGNLLSQGAQIVIINDFSKFWPKLPDAVHQISHTVNRGPAAARNTGIRFALSRGADFVLMTDTDCVPADNWLVETHKAFLSNPYAHAFSGLTKSLNSTWLDRYHEINGTLNGRRFKGSQFLLYGPTCNFAISRLLAETLQFDETFKTAACEDIDFCFRALNAGFRVFHSGEIVIRHDYQYRQWAWIRNAVMFFRQFGKYAKAEASLLAKCPSYHAYFGNTLEISSLLERQHSGT
jgi:GT2 family glycosyltransferase